MILKKTNKVLFNSVFGQSVQSEIDESDLRIVLNKNMRNMLLQYTFRKLILYQRRFTIY